MGSPCSQRCWRPKLQRSPLQKSAGMPPGWQHNRLTRFWMLLRFLLIWQCFLRNFFFFFLGPLKPICFVHIRGGLFASISDPLSVTWGVRFTRVQISILPHCCNKAEFPTTFWYHHGDVFATQDFLGAVAQTGFGFSVTKAPATWAKSPTAAAGPSHMPELLWFAPGKDTYLLAKSLKRTSASINTNFPFCKWKISGTYTSWYTHHDLSDLTSQISPLHVFVSPPPQGTSL